MKTELSEATILRIRQGYLYTHKTAMTDADFASLDIVNARRYIQQAGKAARRSKLRNRTIGLGSLVVFGSMAIAGLGGDSAPTAVTTSPAAITASAAKPVVAEAAKTEVTAPVAAAPVVAPAPVAEPVKVPTPAPAPVVKPTPAVTPRTNCNPNYSGCVANSSTDLDCPDVRQRVQVIGVDEYRLDGDGNGIGCESY